MNRHVRPEKGTACSLLLSWPVRFFPPAEAGISSPAAPQPDKSTIVLDDEPMLVDEASIVVEDSVALATINESATWVAADDSTSDVIEVGDEVVFDV
jgi:hypothetical protein